MVPEHLSQSLLPTALAASALIMRGCNIILTVSVMPWRLTLILPAVEAQRLGHDGNCQDDVAPRVISAPVVEDHACSTLAALR